MLISCKKFWLNNTRINKWGVLYWSKWFFVYYSITQVLYKANLITPVSIKTVIKTSYYSSLTIGLREWEYFLRFVVQYWRSGLTHSFQINYKQIVTDISTSWKQDKTAYATSTAAFMTRPVCLEPAVTLVMESVG